MDVDIIDDEINLEENGNETIIECNVQPNDGVNIKWLFNDSETLPPGVEVNLNSKF